MSDSLHPAGASDLTNSGDRRRDAAERNRQSQLWEIDYNRTSPTGLDNFTGDYLPNSSFVAITAVPEPSMLALLAAGIAGVAAFRRRQATVPR